MSEEIQTKNNIEKVRKRDGRVVDFNQEKIAKAVHKAITAANQGDGKESKKVSDKAVELLNHRFKFIVNHHHFCKLVLKISLN